MWCCGIIWGWMVGRTTELDGMWDSTYSTEPSPTATVDGIAVAILCNRRRRRCLCVAWGVVECCWLGWREMDGWMDII